MARRDRDERETVAVRRSRRVESGSVVFHLNRGLVGRPRVSTHRDVAAIAIAATRRTSRCSRRASATPGAAPARRRLRRRRPCRSGDDRRTAPVRSRGSRATMRTSSSSGTSGALLSSDDRSSDASWPVIRSAPAGSSWISAAIELSVLNRKCGCTRDSSDASCASAASRGLRLRPAPSFGARLVASSNRCRSVSYAVTAPAEDQRNRRRRLSCSPIIRSQNRPRRM